MGEDHVGVLCYKIPEKAHCRRHSRYQQNKTRNQFYSNISEIGSDIIDPRPISDILMGRNTMFTHNYMNMSLVWSMTSAMRDMMDPIKDKSNPLPDS